MAKGLFLFKGVHCFAEDPVEVPLACTVVLLECVAFESAVFSTCGFLFPGVLALDWALLSLEKHMPKAHMAIVVRMIFFIFQGLL